MDQTDVEIDFEYCEHQNLKSYFLNLTSSTLYSFGIFVSLKI